MNSTHTKTLSNIFERPTKSDIRWSEIEALVRALDGKVEDRSGSRVLLEVNGITAIFHRPHPQPTTKKGAVDAVRTFLRNAGVTP
jgi:hypothetical protein